MPVPWDYLWLGHFHTPASVVLNHREALATGSPESGNEYAAEQLAACGSPRQRLAFFDDDHGLIVDIPLYLDDSRSSQLQRARRWVSGA